MLQGKGGRPGGKNEGLEHRSAVLQLFNQRPNLCLNGVISRVATQSLQQRKEFAQIRHMQKQQSGGCGADVGARGLIMTQLSVTLRLHAAAVTPLAAASTAALRHGETPALAGTPCVFVARG